MEAKAGLNGVRQTSRPGSIREALRAIGETHDAGFGTDPAETRAVLTIRKTTGQDVPRATRARGGPTYSTRRRASCFFSAILAEV